MFFSWPIFGKFFSSVFPHILFIVFTIFRRANYFLPCLIVQIFFLQFPPFLFARSNGRPLLARGDALALTNITYKRSCKTKQDKRLPQKIGYAPLTYDTVKTHIKEHVQFRLILFLYIGSFLENQPGDVLKVFLKLF